MSLEDALAANTAALVALTAVITSANTKGEVLPPPTATPPATEKPSKAGVKKDAKPAGKPADLLPDGPAVIAVTAVKAQELFRELVKAKGRDAGLAILQQFGLGKVDAEGKLLAGQSFGHMREDNLEAAVAAIKAAS